jgi:hypothetical protein
MPADGIPNIPPSLDRGVAVKSLTDLWMHQNALMWNRIQLLSAVQAGVLASNYVLHKGFVSIFLYLAAMIATLYLNYMWAMDHEIRNVYGIRLRDLGFDIACSDEERHSLKISIVGVRVPVYLHSQISLTHIFLGIMVVDTVVFVVSLFMFPFL